MVCVLFLGGNVDQDGEVGHENIVLILLYLCCLDFFNTSGENEMFFFCISDFVSLEVEK